MASKFEGLPEDSDLARGFAERQGDNNGKMIGEILNEELAKDAEKFPRAKEIKDELQTRFDAMPPMSAAEISREAAAKAAKNAPTPVRDFLNNGLKA